jgi:hypothetical protein
MDQNQPQWSPPPQQPMGWGGPGYGGAPVRPTSVTLGSIFLIVMGIIVCLAGGCATIGGSLLGGAAGQSSIPGLGALGGAVAVVGIIILVIGILQVAAGAGALGGAGWARWTGIVISIILVIFGVLGLLGAVGSMSTPGSGGITSLLISLLITVGYALTAYAFITNTAWFTRRR